MNKSKIKGLVFFGVFFLVFGLIIMMLFENVYIKVSDYLWSIFDFDFGCVILGIMFLILVIITLVFYFTHRQKTKLVEVVEFKSPDDMTPVELGYLVDGSIESKDLSSLLVYWAGKKYISISKGKKNQTLKKIVKTLPKEARDYEKKLFDEIFGDADEIKVDSIPSKLSGTSVVSELIKNVKHEGAQYVKTGVFGQRQLIIIAFCLLFTITIFYLRLEYFTDVVPIIESFAVVASTLFAFIVAWNFSYDNTQKSKAKTASRVCLILTLLLIAGLCYYFFMTDMYQVIILVVECALLGLCVLLLNKVNIYTKSGIKKLGEILGFKNFLVVAEKDRIKMLAQENPHLFYDVLPYAYVLGVSDKWIKNFNVIQEDYELDSRRIEILVHFLDITTNAFDQYFEECKNKVEWHIGSGDDNVGGGSNISFGSNNGAGKNVGGSNFGGVRRR